MGPMGPFKYYVSKEVGGVRKWQFLLIYSTIYADVGGWAYKSQKHADVILEFKTNGPIVKFSVVQKCKSPLESFHMVSNLGNIL